MLVRAPDGRDVLVAGQKSGVVYALDPANKGKLLWQSRVGKGGTNGGVQWGTASDGRNVYASVSDVVRVRTRQRPGANRRRAARSGAGRRIDRARYLRRQQGLVRPEHALCPPPRPGCSPAQPGAVTAVPGLVFSGSMDGHIRAFSTADGTPRGTSIRRRATARSTDRGQGRIARRRRAGRCRQHDVRELRVSPFRRGTGKRASRVCHRMTTTVGSSSPAPRSAEGL